MRDFTKTKRIVIKIGTNILTKKGSIKIDDAFIKRIAKQVASLRKQGIQSIIVTSGAIGMGAGQLELPEVSDPKLRQACAAIGQPLLMESYRKAFKTYKIKTAQVLLTSHVLDQIVTYKNLQIALDKLLDLKVVPILNENDCVSTEEINLAFGDNDKLSARVASKIKADLLIMLSDIDALYDKDPNKSSEAQPIRYVDSITKQIIQSAGSSSGSKYATGGMKSKIEAVKIAFDAGCRIILAGGRTENILNRIIDGEEIGTLFVPKGVSKLNDRQRWIKNTSPAGKIKVETLTLLKKIRKNQDILPKDIQAVKGIFPKGAVLTINDDHKTISQLSSEDLKKFKGRTQREIKSALGKGEGKLIVAKHADIVSKHD